VTAGRKARIRRLLADLRRGRTRGEALRRIRRRAVSEVRRRFVGGPAGQGRPAEWARLSEAVIGVPAPSTGGAPNAAAMREVVDLARGQRLQALLARFIGEGRSLEAAVCLTVRALAETTEWTDWNAAWAMTEGVGRLPGGVTASALGHALLHHRRKQFDRAWRRAREVDDAVLGEHIPVEAIDGALSAGDRDRAIAIGRPTTAMAPSVAVDLAGRFLAMGERDAAAALVAELGRRAIVDLDARRRRSLALIESWLGSSPPAVPAGSVPLGVLTYRTPDHQLTSGNLGDLIQTLGMVGNIVRFSGVTFTGDDGLGALATELQGRVPEALRLPEPRAAVHLVPVDRDFTSAGDVPAGTWTIAFGWHMHPLFDLRYDFPYHEHVRPLFISFHVNRLEMLSDAAIDYLRRHGPIGCRDWNTVFVLLSAGVDAFFSGCVTTTVDALFPPRSAAYRGGGVVGLIDQPVEAAGGARNVRVYSHQADEYRTLDLADGLRTADRALGAYQRDLDRAITGRLHAYLPLTALGVPVEFRTGSPGDVRFAGLTGLRPDHPRLVELRRGIRDLLGPTLERIIAGAGEDEVYGLWRDLTKARVAEARTRFEAPVVDPPAVMDTDAAIATCLAGSRRFGPHDQVDPAAVTDVALSFDQNVALPAAVLVESVLANASGPVRLWILCRGIGAAYQDWLGRAFPSLPITFLPCDGIGYGPSGRPRRVPSRITISTMDRLLLPGMLDDVERIVYLDVDTLMVGDVTELARTDLGGAPIAACDTNVGEATGWQRVGRALAEDEALELRRRTALQHGFGHLGLNAGVLVMDLARMRRDGFVAASIGLVERYGLHDQDTMLVMVGPDRARLDSGWNAMPVLEDVDDPRLVHWASFNKPWDELLTPQKVRWREYAARLHARAGTPPLPDAGTAPEDRAAAPVGTLPNPMAVGPVVGELSPAIERIVEAVRAEHLSYLDAPSLRTLAATVQEVEAAGIAGLVIEAGTALGGSAIVIATAKGRTTPMRVYDVFGMIPPPTERDGADVHRRYATIVAGRSKGLGGDTYYGYHDDLLGEVTASFARHGLPLAEHGIELVQGRFEETLVLDEPVAFAHLDGDWYSSTMTCLTQIAPRLAPGGRIVIDDYDTWSGCRAAVHDYFAGRSGFRFERRGRLHVVRLPA
jgi:lipopolysaccharide biosynthesis glycosyltransferase